ncbi:hypothetical protein [Deinococcus phoenicis]|nr:hypothetical protein [Deinococcus phoenicis]
MNRLPAAVLMLAALLGPGLTGCGPRAEPDLTARVLFTASGSYDARADVRERTGGGLRRVVWQSRPPLPAGAVTVRYDGDARTLAWDMRVQAPQFSARSLAGEDARTVQTPAGEGLRPTGGRLAEVLILPTPEGLRLLTRGYATQQEPALLPAFGGR